MAIGTDGTLAAPSIDEADGGYLRPDMMPFGPTVRILLPLDSAVGDVVTLRWGGGPSNDGYWTGERTLEAAGGTCTFRVPFLVLVAAESSDVTLQYDIQRPLTGMVRTSRSSTFTVQDYPLFSLLQVYDHDGLPTRLVDHRAPWFEVRLPDDIAVSLRVGDEVVVSARGVLDQIDSSMIQAASTVWRQRIDAANLGATLRHRFSRDLIEANYGDGMLLRASIVRASGYIQYPGADVEVRISRDKECLPPVDIDVSTGDVVILDELAPGRGLDVSVMTPAQARGAAVRFFLGNARSDAYTVDADPVVDGMISREILEHHADSDCHLYCLVTKPGGDGFETIVGRSPRRRITIRRKRADDPLPRADPYLEPPTIDGVSQEPIDPARFPNGASARIPAGAEVMEGDLVTLFLRIPGCLTAWKECIFVEVEDEGFDIVRRIPQWYLSYAQDKEGWLYYSIERSFEKPRYSEAVDVAIAACVPRHVYPFACSMKREWDNAEMIACSPRQRLQLGVQNAVMRFAPGDDLVATFLGHSGETSATIEVPIDEEPDPWFFLDVPEDIIRRNAGHALRYRVTRVRQGHIDHSPYRSLAIQPADTDRRGRSLLADISRRLLAAFRRSPSCT